jgi:acyl-coenzyme A synthetase/AMP-(fatty) acid ligase
VPHDLLGEAIVVFVSWCSAMSESTPPLLEHCRRKLPPSRAPQAIVHLSELPHNGSGKILKESLRQFAAEFINASNPNLFRPEPESLRAVRIERRSDYADVALETRDNTP